MTPNTLITKVGDNISADLGDGVQVNMNVDLGRYYEVNAAAGRILAHLETPKTLGQLVELVCAEFDVSPDACQRDTIEFLERLRALGLARFSDSPAA